MMAIYLTSDCHFNHKNIIKYETITRPFSDIEDMNETIVRNWNNTVVDEDTVYVLGDFCMGGIDTIMEYVPRLAGKIVLIRGNHDTDKRIAIYESLGIEVVDFKQIEYKGILFCMSHYPMWNEEMSKSITKNGKRAMIWCYGHVHSAAPIGYHDGSFHVGVDTNGLRPVNIEDIYAARVNDISQKPVQEDIYFDNSELADKVYDFLHHETRQGYLSIVYGDTYYLHGLYEKYGKNTVDTMIKKMMK